MRKNLQQRNLFIKMKIASYSPSKIYNQEHRHLITVKLLKAKNKIILMNSKNTLIIFSIDMTIQNKKSNNNS